ncbi:hypothetical protein OG894_43930 (plasmid) [Streptomyces sp. NBC_01724]|uniref:hypothetical protein n=1 Tax=Streptomyces sp. NBC_01724 TaxID=2975922 RepID=UPI002E3065A6|nr:hypothetical protein [Streptomyces sp. NBC_01724]
MTRIVTAPMATTPDTDIGPSSDTDARPNSSVRCGFRVLRVLSSLGMDDEHQVSTVADATGLLVPHVSKLLKAGVAEGLVAHGSRRGTYRLTHRGLTLTGLAGTRQTTPRIRQTATDLHEETGLAVAVHEPAWRLGLGLHLTLVDAECQITALCLVAAEGSDIRRSAPGRAALAHLPASLATDADDRPILLPAGMREGIRASRVAATRSERTHTLSTCVLRGEHVVATLSLIGLSAAFAEPLRVQEYAVLLRRAAERAGAPAPAPGLRLTGRRAVMRGRMGSQLLNTQADLAQMGTMR